MRSLATDDYTAAEVEAQLRAPAARYTARFEVYSADGQHAGDLDDVVTAARVEFDADRPIQGALDLEMLPDPSVAGELYLLRIQPWFGVVMPDGGVAEYPQGRYVWTNPDRHLAGVGDAETWSVTLPDQGWTLESGGPGLRAFRLDPGDRFTRGLERLLRRAGFTDTAGVVDSDEELEEMLSWSRRRNIEFRVLRSGKWDVDVDTQPETWRTIADDLTDPIGYDRLWFDHVGRPRATPSVDLATADPEVVYATERDGILLTPIPVTHDLARVANRVFCRAKMKRGDAMRVGAADLNDLIPDHPLAERRIRTYIDVDVDVRTGQGVRGLERQARRILYRRLTALEQVQTPSLAWPVHDAYNLVGVRFDGDRQLNQLGKFHEKAWDLTLVGPGVGTMNHQLQHVIGATRL